MEIKKGFDNKKTTLKISVQENGAIELWLNESGKDDRETLSYMSADELLQLFREVQSAGKDLFQ